MSRRIKLALLINIVHPYRIPIYVRLGKAFQTTALLSGKEDNALKWQGMEKPLVENGVTVKIAGGFSYRYKNKTKDGQVFEKRNLHINPGYFSDLVRENPDVVISTEMGFRSVMALLYGVLFHKPVWLWWGGTSHTEKKRVFLKHWLRWAIVKMARHWISYGNTSTDYLQRIGVKRERILQIQNCVDENIYARLVEPAYAYQPRPVFLLAGQMIMRKGFDLYLNAAAKIQKEGCRFTTLLVGDGPEKESIRQLAVTLGLQDIHMLPPHSPDKMASVYRSADVFVFPTLEDVWGLVINESLWSGVPVLSSIYAGCTSEIVPLENRFDPLDPQDFERVLRLVIDHKIQPADTSPLLTSEAVAQLIIDDIQENLGITDGNTAKI